ncbi:MAG TPA: GNAT family N-acetyltransferase [Xanthobacteraceae bacterium]|nr:GNAT family N-acetyltransferase [Xanthobacteraceae bacterium]
MIGLVEVIDDLPSGVEVMQAEARAEGYRHLERLAADWAARAMRFDSAGEALLAAYVNSSLVGIGGLTHEPAVAGAFRMRRFYVRPLFRRQGVGSELALILIEQAFRTGRFVTVNAGNVDAPTFWEKLGFAPSPRDGYTHALSQSAFMGRPASRTTAPEVE